MSTSSRIQNKNKISINLFPVCYQSLSIILFCSRLIKSHKPQRFVLRHCLKNLTMGNPVASILLDIQYNWPAWTSISLILQILYFLIFSIIHGSNFLLMFITICSMLFLYFTSNSNFLIIISFHPCGVDL